MKRIGVIINPIAGVGGQAGYKGSDDAEMRRRAMDAGYKKNAALRAAECLQVLKNLNGYHVIAPVAEMGGDMLSSLGIEYEGLECCQRVTTCEDTKRCAGIYKKLGVDLVVFCGGDGTARDICEVLSNQIPVLGVPAGVKMYSACFSINPYLAGEILRDYILGHPFSCEMREVMDIDEKQLGIYCISPHLYGYLLVLNARARLQMAKSVSTASPDETDAMASYFASEMGNNILYIVGPGSTTYKIKQKCCGTGSLLGVDAIINGKMVAKDTNENTLFSLVEKMEQAVIIVTCIGGAGFVFGRGNQQISPRIIRKVTKGNIWLAVTKEKLAELMGRPMLVDTGEPATDRYLSGYYIVKFNSHEAATYKIDAI